MSTVNSGYSQLQEEVKQPVKSERQRDKNDRELRNALINNDVETFRDIFDNKDISVCEINKSIIYASRYGSDQIASFLLELEVVDPAIDNNEPIIAASAWGNIEVLKLLLNEKRKIRLPILDGSLRSYIDFYLAKILKKFLRVNEKPDPTARNSLALELAVINGHIEVVRKLLEDGRVKPDDNNHKSLVEAASAGHIEIAQLLIEYSNTRKMIDNFDKIPGYDKALILASRNGYFEMVKLICHNTGASPVAKNFEAIRIACRKGYYDMARFLATKVDITSLPTSIILLLNLHHS